MEDALIKQECIEKEEVDSKRQICEYCPQTFLYRKNLVKHKKAHEEKQELHTCEVCHKSFIRLQSLVNHRFTHKTQKQFSCDKCPKQFCQLKSLKRHKMVHTGEKQVQPYKCDQCFKSLLSMESLQEHKKTHIFMCEMCPKTFTNENKLQEHRNIHTGEKPFICEYCSLGFTSETYLHTHTKRHLNENRFLCDFCSKVFSRAKDMIQHKKAVHLKIKPHQCDHCDKAFPTLQELKNHKKVPDLLCKYCPKMFKKPSELARHQQTHERPFPCEICLNSFISQQKLDSHFKTHTSDNVKKIRPRLPCHLCEKTFEKNSDLLRHIRMHTGERPYKCDKCSKGFTQSNSLKIHKKTHEKEILNFDVANLQESYMQRNIVVNNGLTVPILVAENQNHIPLNSNDEQEGILNSNLPQNPLHPCHVCEKTFKKKSHLLNHIKIHTGERPYKCDECSKAFIESSKLQRHKKTHEKGNDEKEVALPRNENELIISRATNSTSLLATDTALYNSKDPLAPNLQNYRKILPKIPTQQLEQVPNYNEHENAQLNLKEEDILNVSFENEDVPASIYYDLVIKVEEENEPNEVTEQLDDKVNVKGELVDVGECESEEIQYDDRWLPVKSEFSELFEEKWNVNNSLDEDGGRSPIEDDDIDDQNKNGDIRLQMKSSPPDVKQKRTSCKECGHPVKGHPKGPCPFLPRTRKKRTCKKCGHPAKGHPTGPCQQLPLSDMEMMQQQEIGPLYAVKNKKRLYDKKGEANIYKCPECLKTFSQSSSLKRHVLTHSAEKPHHCHNCDKSFSDPSNLKRHLETHSGERADTGERHLCEHCAKSFKSDAILKTHFARIHSVERPYQCTSCPKSFSLERLLRMHFQIHTGINPFQCDQCPKSFNKKSALKIHMRTHTGEKPYLCHLCTATFTQGSGLQQHLKWNHGGIMEVKRPFSCTVCGKGFTLESNLQKHLENKGEKAFPCTMSMCPRIFHFKSMMEVHLLTHTGEKPHSCDICMRKFPQLYSLKRHKRIIHKIIEEKKEDINILRRQFACDMCDRKYVQSCHLGFHKRKAHGGIST